MTKPVKLSVFFDWLDSGTTEIETLWAEPSGEGWRVDNIPFYAKSLALNDLVLAKKGEDGELLFERLLSPSGHSTIRLWFASEEFVQDVRDALRAMGCESELSDLSRLVAVDVPPDVNYEEVSRYLDSLEHSGVLEYEEACLGFRRDGGG
jgi:hypothetical protein